LVWDAKLAADAASYGPVLASMRRLVHSPRDSRPGERENLAMAWHGTLGPEQLVDMWSREKLLLTPGLFPNVSQTGQWEDVAHYTQMVWPTTTHVGCGDGRGAGPQLRSINSAHARPKTLHKRGSVGLTGTEFVCV
jgi:hypothetical protein